MEIMSACQKVSLLFNVSWVSEQAKLLGLCKRLRRIQPKSNRLIGRDYIQYPSLCYQFGVQRTEEVIPNIAHYAFNFTLGLRAVGLATTMLKRVVAHVVRENRHHRPVYPNSLSSQYSP